MKPCLGEKSLVRLFAGAGSESERAHLASCDACRGRADAIGRDVDRIAIALREAAAEKPRGSRASPESARRWWPALAGVAAAAGIAAALLSSAPRPSPSGADIVRRAEPEQMRASVRDLSQAMFQVGDPRGVPMPRRPSSAELVNAALAGWPCGDGESFAVSCR
jgi:ferric-dicitrate binding protein FerR (iron transport regulator)